jgi:hypothetical protein
MAVGSVAVGKQKTKSGILFSFSRSRSLDRVVYQYQYHSARCRISYTVDSFFHSFSRRVCLTDPRTTSTPPEQDQHTRTTTKKSNTIYSERTQQLNKKEERKQCDNYMAEQKQIDPLTWEEEEEEEKESSPEKTGSGGGSVSTTTTTAALEKATATAGLPKEINANKKYASERELRIDLEEFGLGDLDLHIVLNKDGFPVWREMPGKEHGAEVEELADLFDEWKNGNGRLIKGAQKTNVFVNDSFSNPKKEKRCPDFAIFGPDRMIGRKKIRKVNGQPMNPHVIIQFSWTNSIVYEKEAVDDMMNYAGMGESHSGLGRPNIAYLIKALRRGEASNSPVYGFNVFQVGQDQTTPQEPTMKYRVGRQEDTVISIAPAEMGFVDDGEGEPFLIRMSDIREELEQVSVSFVPAFDNEV